MEGGRAGGREGMRMRLGNPTSGRRSTRCTSGGGVNRIKKAERWREGGREGGKDK